MPILYHASTAVSIISPKLSYKTCYYSALRLHSNKRMHTDCKKRSLARGCLGLALQIQGNTSRDSERLNHYHNVTIQPFGFIVTKACTQTAKNAVWRVAASGLPCKCKATPFHLSLHKTLLIFLDQYLSSKILALTLDGSSTVRVPASLFQ